MGLLDRRYRRRAEEELNEKMRLLEDSKGAEFEDLGMDCYAARTNVNFALHLGLIDRMKADEYYKRISKMEDRLTYNQCNEEIFDSLDEKRGEGNLVMTMEEYLSRIVEARAGESSCRSTEAQRESDCREQSI